MSRNPWRAIRAVERLRGIRPFEDYPIRDTGLSSAAGGPLYERPEDVIAEEPRVWEAWASLINAWPRPQPRSATRPPTLQLALEIWEQIQSGNRWCSYQRTEPLVSIPLDDGTPDLTVGRAFAWAVAL